jgi:hypothetical protein
MRDGSVLKISYPSLSPGKAGLTFSIPAKFLHLGPHPETGKMLLLLQMEQEWVTCDGDKTQPHLKGSLSQLDPICVVRDAESHIVLYHPRMPEYEPHLTWQQKRWLREHPNFPW